VTGVFPAAELRRLADVLAIEEEQWTRRAAS